MAGTSADKLVKLKATKADLKAALTEKGQTPGDLFSAYPNMVRAITTGENLDDELTQQDTLIANILTALDGKAAGGGAEYIEVTMIAQYGKIQYVNENGELSTVLAGSTVTAKVYRGVVTAQGSVLGTQATGNYVDLSISSAATYIFKSDGGTVTALAD